MLLRILLLYSLILGSSWSFGFGPPPHLSIEKQWKLLTYNFEWNAPVHKDFFNPAKIVITSIAVDKNRIFLATPRLFSGVPATVSSISRDQVGDSPVLEAYPNWSFHTAGLREYNCTYPGLVSVYRVRIDSCNRLWVLDAGVSRSFEDSEMTCPPKILIFDITTDKLVRQIDFPREVYKGETLFTNFVIDETTSKPGNNCNDVFVYVCDTVQPGIIVHDSLRHKTWRVSHPSMFPNPDFAESNIHGDKFVLMDGIIGLGLDSHAGLLYYQPTATIRLFAVSTKALRAGPLSQNQTLPAILVGNKSSQGVALAVSSADGSLLFSPFSETAVVSWNPIRDELKVLAYDPEAFQFVAHITYEPRDPSVLYVLSSRFHKFYLKRLNRNAINLRILRIDTKPAFL